MGDSKLSCLGNRPYGRSNKKAEELQASELIGLGLRAFDPEAFRVLFQTLAT